MGCRMPIPPASDAAATSSGLLHGYMAPQISGTSIPACSVSAVPHGFLPSTAILRLSSGTQRCATLSSALSPGRCDSA